MRKLFAMLRSALTLARKDDADAGFAPYTDPACNQLYNLLFCDQLALLRHTMSEPLSGNWSTLLADVPYVAGLKAIAEDETQDSRARIVAYNRLRDLKQPVPQRKLLGVVVEVALPSGLDVLAAYLDGCVRHIRHDAKLSIFDPVPAWLPQVKRLLSAAQNAVERIGPWQQSRVPPPTEGMIRMSFLVSDGLYFGQGLTAVMEKDELAQPIIDASNDLLKSVTS